MNDETQLCEPTQKLHQGDIIRISDQNNQHHPNLGIIINADCDLENNKIDGVIAYLPIYSFEEYIKKFWIENYVRQKRDSSLANIGRICKLSSVELSDLLDWISSSTPESIADKIIKSSTKKTDAAVVKNELDTVHKCISLDCNGLEILTYFCEQAKPKHMDTAKKMVAEAKKNMGDGHFFVSEIVGEQDIGFVIRMRRIYTIDANKCFTSIAEQRAKIKGKEISAGRIARLTPLYQFKVAQLFANQYSRIGLPNEVTQLSELAVDSLAQQLAGGIK